MGKPPIGTTGTVRFPHGAAAAIVTDHADGERDLIATVFCNAATSAEGIDGVVALYPTKVGDQISDFQPSA